MEQSKYLIHTRGGANAKSRHARQGAAGTVAAKSYGRHEEGHGWLGIRFQAEPRAQPSDIILHARMWDQDNARQQEALGILGVNLVYGAHHERGRPEGLIGSLMDGLSRDRMEVDMIKFSGPAFAGVDNRLMSLQLVQQRLTNAAMFSPDGEVVEPAEPLHERPVLIERGSFRPVTMVTRDMLERARERVSGDPVVLMEMTLRNLLSPGEPAGHADFLARLGMTVMISNYSRFHSVTTYLRRYTRERIAMVLGVPTLTQVFDEKHYPDLEGGLLEALGRLLSGPVTLYVYPWKNARSGEVVTAENFTVPARLRHLYAHLLENNLIEPIREVGKADLSVLPRDVLSRLQSGDPGWEALVPEEVVRMIKAQKLFGYRAPDAGTR